MKVFQIATAVLACGCVFSHGAQLVANRGTPMERVVGLLTDLEAKIELDGKLEQDSYDKYACWCESTLARKANDIAEAKELIKELEEEMIKLNGEIASHGAEIKQLKKDIAANLDSQREATEVRDNQFEEYKEERTESEQCIGALEAAIKVLTGAGTGAGKFLETLQESQLISVAAGVRHAVGKAMAMSKDAISDTNLKVVRDFMNRPEDFVGKRSAMLSAAQIANNPFGDYAPQSTQIQGILKGMYDSFTTSLEKANAEESEQQKSHEELMATKQMELKTLQLTLEKQTLDKAEKTKKLAEDKQLSDDTKVQLEADEVFFADTKAACKVKASEWSERTRLRTEELHGIGKAIQIMTSPEAQQVFENATTTFLQLSKSNSVSEAKRVNAFKALRQMAKEYRSVSLVDLAAEVQTGGHFDKVIESIDKMIAFLRTEEAADINHRDRCQGAENKNTNDKDDLDHEIDKTGKTITRLEGESKATQTKIDATEADIKATISDMETLLQMRNDQHAEFVQALKDDSDAIELLEMAIVALTKFYKKNKIPLSLLSTKPEYTEDPDKAPETTWDGGNYGGKTSETGGVVAIIGMLKEDLEKEMKTARQEEADDQANYEKDRAAMQAVLDAHKATKVSLERKKADIDSQIFDRKEYKGQKSDDLDSELKLSKALYEDCSWVATHFESRRTARKKEMAGLNEAKDYLAGVE